MKNNYEFILIIEIYFLLIEKESRVNHDNVIVFYY